MKVGTKVVNLENQNGYMVVGYCTLKNPHTREWQPGIIYLQDPAPEVGKREIFVREKEDFIIKFREKT